MNILFKNVRLQEDKTDHGICDMSHEVGVKDTKIVFIGNGADENEYDRVVDCRQNLLMPAFYNAHTHSAMNLLRGMGEGLPLQRWLEEKIFPAEDHLNFRRTHYGSRLAIAEMIKNGVVSFTDMYMFEDATAIAALDCGVKANISRCIVSFDPNQSPENDMRFSEAKSLVEQYHGAADGRIRIDMALHAEYTNVEKTCRYVSEYAKEKNLRMHLHLSETEKEHTACVERHGMTPAAWFSSLGVFDVPTTAAHCVWLTEEDIDILREKNVFVAHNPISNMKLGSGFMPLDTYLNRGLQVCIGTDGAASNNALSVLRDLQFAALATKGLQRSPELITPTQLIRMATKVGALSQGREDCGELVVGNRADLILVDLNSLNNLPAWDPAGVIAYSATEGDILMTMCDGRILYENGEYTSIDIECLRFESRQVFRHYFD